MKLVIGFLAGMAMTGAVSVAAECLQDGGLTPMVQIFDMRTRQKIADCRVAMTLLDGHRIMCQRQ